MADIDDIFMQTAMKEEAKAKASSKSNRTFVKEYEHVEWTGLETGKPCIFRAVGSAYNSNVDKYTARTVTIASVIGDDGKKFKLIRPSMEENPNYIINRIINKVRSPKWVNGEKTFPVQEAHPEIVNLIEKNGLEEKDSQYKFDRGWLGSEVLIMNIIDREQMDWHRENKHTRLLAKSVREKDGNRFVEEGISSFASIPKIAQLYKFYHSWEGYDIAITKTGDMKNAYNIDNASKNPERVPGYDHLISFETSLTEEEKSWEKYDLEKFYRQTSMQKIYNRLRNTIRKIDNALGTTFLADLEKEVEKEKEILSEVYGEEELPTFAPTSTPTPRTRESKSTNYVVGSELPYYNTLSESLRSKITKVSKNSNGTFDIHWDMAESLLAACPECNATSPSDGVNVCPACGCEFA